MRRASTGPRSRIGPAIGHFFSQSAKDELFLPKTGACSIGFLSAERYSREKKTRVAGPRDPQAFGCLLTALRSATSVKESGSRPAQEPKPEKNAGGKGRSRRNKKYDNPLSVFALRVTEASLGQKRQLILGPCHLSYLSIYRSFGSLPQSSTEHSAWGPKVYFARGPFFFVWLGTFCGRPHAYEGGNIMREKLSKSSHFWTLKFSNLLANMSGLR